MQAHICDKNCLYITGILAIYMAKQYQINVVDRLSFIFDGEVKFKLILQQKYLSENRQKVTQSTLFFLKIKASEIIIGIAKCL